VLKETPFRTSSTTRRTKIAKKIDVMHYNTITSNRQTGSVFRKENLAEISRSEAKTLFLPSGGQSTVLHYTSVPAPGRRSVCIRQHDSLASFGTFVSQY